MRTNSRRALTLSLLLPLATTAAHAQAAAAPPPAAPAASVVTGGAAAAPALRAVGPQAGFGDVLVVGTGARFEVAAGAEAGQVTLLDGVEATAAALAGPWAPGSHTLSVQAPRAEGATAAPVAPLRFVYDPSAPQLQWELGDTKLLDSNGLDQNVHRDKPPRRVDPDRDKHVPLLWSPDGRRWLPVLAKGAKPDAQGVLADWLVAADKPQLFLWALEDGTLGPAAPVTPRKMQIVRVWGGDALSAVRELRLRVLPGDPRDPARAYQLEMLATDLVGNQSSMRWPLARR